MASHLASKIAIVTGGSRGIGLAIAAALLDEGASVAISGLNQEHLDVARRTLTRTPTGSRRCAPTCGSVRERGSAASPPP